MKSFGVYITKHFASFAVFLLLLMILNGLLFGVTFYRTVSGDYGETSPRSMLEMSAAAADTDGLSEEMSE